MHNNTSIYIIINMKLSICLLVHLFSCHFETNFDVLWHKVAFCFREGSKTTIFGKTWNWCAKNKNALSQSDDYQTAPLYFQENDFDTVPLSGRCDTKTQLFSLASLGSSTIYLSPFLSE